LQFETPPQLAGDFPGSLKPCRNLQETIVGEHRFAATCRRQLLGNIGSAQLAGEKCSLAIACRGCITLKEFVFWESF
jgi:hypothetical protein